MQLVRLAKRYSTARLHVVLTGRPLRFRADKAHPLWDWDTQSSRMAQQASAARAVNFMRHFGVQLPVIYDGGIAPRTVIPHHAHFAEYYKFRDLDPLEALRYSDLEPMEDIIREVLTWEDGSAAVVVGGPLTGLLEMIMRCPDVIAKFSEVHARDHEGRPQRLDRDHHPAGDVAHHPDRRIRRALIHDW